MPNALPPFPIRRGALVVSCQARADNPLHGPVFMAAMACAAAQGGAGAVRAAGLDDIRAIRAGTHLAIIGLIKRFEPQWPVYITPSLADAETVLAAGADIVAVDATDRLRNGEPALAIIGTLTKVHRRHVLADVATVTDGQAAVAAGASAVATTLAGYTGPDPVPRGTPPDLDLLSALVAACPVPVLAEGRYDTPDLAVEALRRGAYAVVVGTAITNPREITRGFVGRLQEIP